MADEVDDDIISPLINKKAEENEEEKKSKNTEEEEENKIIEENNEKKIKYYNPKIISKNKLSGKVYFVFFLQSLIIFLFIYYAFHNETFKNLLQNNHKFFYVSVILAAAIMVASGMVKLFSVVPFNYFFFLIFSLCMSIIICKLLILFSFKTISIFWSLLVCMILSLSIYSLRMKKEIKLLSTSFFVFVILLIVGLFVKFIVDVPIVDMLLIILCLISFNVYLIYDVNLLIEERGISSRDYFTLNILLYLDIIMNFIRLFNFIYKNIQSDEKDETMDKIKGFTEDLEKGIGAVKNFGKEKKDEEDGDDDEEEDKKKKKGKKGKKEDKKGKKEDKKDKKGKKDDKKGKKDDKKGKKDKKKKKGSDDDDEGGDLVKDIISGLFG